MERVGLQIKDAILEDIDQRKALYERFVYSTSQIDPSAQRANGAEALNINPW